MKHTHTHSPKHIKAISNRLSRTIGHLEAIKKMVERDEDCSDILIQILLRLKQRLTIPLKPYLKNI